MRDPTGFLAANTRLSAHPLVPGIALHLAEELTPLWQATEAWLGREGVAPPYWAFAWPGSAALARWLLDDPAPVRGLGVLDFGAGSGLAAIAAATAGAAEVLAADTDPLAAAAIRLNAAANGVALAVTTRDVVGEAGPWQAILAGDVCYERPMAERVSCWLRAEAARGVAVYLADPGRAYLPREGLLPLARFLVPTRRELEDREEREVTVYRLG
ncbi:MAG: 50S ribosomal protein L11 methyltransferase [Acetobacteraceae bacterium]|nr:50S ribosomal protein L11 methyltransferase [Acetobacteraceae bacterium]MCX7686338.1 50S ribosomal protein L11 methyltransferase [Acetobacteraceae bacterium]MDW8399734.1 50S ribosomal protein L11 methyltransferase [Acetobacteraceae bacterium]